MYRRVKSLLSGWEISPGSAIIALSSLTKSGKEDYNI